MKRQNKLNRASALVFAAALIGGAAPAFAGTLPQCPGNVAPNAAPGDCDLGIRNGGFEYGIKDSFDPKEFQDVKEVPGWHFGDGTRTLITEYTRPGTGSWLWRKQGTVLFLKGGEWIRQAVRPTRGAIDAPNYIVTFAAGPGSDKSGSLAVSLVGQNPGKPEREIWRTNVSMTNSEPDIHTFRVPVTGDVPEYMFIRLESKGSPVIIDDVSLTQTYR